MFLPLLLLGVIGADEATTIHPAVRDELGVLVHEVQSPYQSGTTQIRVLVPDDLRSDERCRVIYVLPVEANRAHHYGDGLEEVLRQKLHAKQRAIFVAPTFSQLPWYADHPSDGAIRQEKYFMNVVVPFVERTYQAVSTREGRLLLGFSKSGWGAWSLLLRHPDVFGKAAAWDAPLAMQEVGKFGSLPIFGDQQNFERYRITDLLRSRGGAFGDSSRLILTGYGNFHRHHEQTHALLDELKIPHVYRDGPKRTHDWHSGWLAATVELLLADSDMSKR